MGFRFRALGFRFRVLVYGLGLGFWIRVLDVGYSVLGFGVLLYGVVFNV